MLPLSSIYKINGTPIPSPTEASVSIEDLEVDAYRTADGVLHRERARQGVRKVSFKYDILTQSEYASLLTQLSPLFFELTYLDPQRGASTIECYSSKKEGSLYSALLYNGLYRDITFNCIER